MIAQSALSFIPSVAEVWVLVVWHPTALVKSSASISPRLIRPSDKFHRRIEVLRDLFRLAGIDQLALPHVIKHSTRHTQQRQQYAKPSHAVFFGPSHTNTALISATAAAVT